MDATVAHIMKIIDQLAPPWLAEKWDNVGLQIGDPRLPVRRIWVALDPTPKVVKAACENKVDLLITHHPLIFKPLKSIDFETKSGTIIQLATLHQLAIFSAHTNYDIVHNGVNDILAQRLGLKHLEVLHPVEFEPQARKEMIGIGADQTAYGIGRIGSLAGASSLDSLVSMIKQKLKLDYVKVAGNPKLKIKRVAVCSGSGSSLMPTFLKCNAQVYISGDIHYHDAREVEAINRAIIDIGHFASEHLMVEALARQLQKLVTENEIRAEITACSLEKDPFRIQ